jgi:dipeptide/tripeptide permease
MSALTDIRALLGAPRELWLVYAIKLNESIAYFTIYTLLAIFLSTDLGMGDEEAGTIVGTWLTVVSLVVQRAPKPLDRRHRPRLTELTARPRDD